MASSSGVSRGPASLRPPGEGWLLRAVRDGDGMSAGIESLLGMRLWRVLPEGEELGGSFVIEGQLLHVTKRERERVENLPTAEEVAAMVELFRTYFPISKELVLWCPCLSWSGAEGPIAELGRWPVLWTCDSCGRLEVEVR